MSEQKHQQFKQKTPNQRGPVSFQIEEAPAVSAILLVPDSSKAAKSTPENAALSLADRLEEAEGLANAIDLEVREKLPIPLDKIRPATLFGTGKVDELKALINASEVDLVIIDHALSPGQQRNLEKIWQVKILDRTGLILEIFGRRAATREGRLQVDLAHLNYQKSRLVRSWTHLERQRGGAGFMGGPGETQLEADKRQLQGKILNLTRELEKVKKTRQLHRAKRAKVPYPIIALVGYTNAGKSTLFNRLTGAEVTAKDQLFATLDPTMRAIELPGGTRAILSDTVGFISNLPTQLIAAFRATLEEVLEADIILHVKDIANSNHKQHEKDVLAILKELGVNQANGKDPTNQHDRETPIITIWNKIDRLQMEEREEGKEGEPATKSGNDQRPLETSAITGEGIDQLLDKLEQMLAKEEIKLQLSLKPHQGRALNWLYQNAEVKQGTTGEDGATEFEVTIAKHLTGRLNKLLQA